MNLDVLIDTMVTDAQVARGENIQGLLVGDYKVRSQLSTNQGRAKARPWTQADREFYEANVGILSYAEIAAQLGRSPEAIKVFFTRRKLTPMTKVPGYLTAQKVSGMLGLDAHKIVTRMDEGIMPGEKLPSDSSRFIYRVSLVGLKMWLVRPTTWIYIRPELIKHESLRRLVQLAMARWGDEWMNTVQAAEYLGCTHENIVTQIERGKLPGVRADFKGGRSKKQHWGLWYVKKSDLVGYTIGRGKGGTQKLYHWPEGADRFLLWARAKGWTWKVIGRMMKWTPQRVSYRYSLLQKNQLEEG
jgi:hypothetical protein